MSIGLNFVRRLCEDGARSSLGAINPDWLTADELVVYDFAKEHLRQYGQLPSGEAFRAAGHRIAVPSESTEFYVAQIRRRATFNQIITDMPTLRGALDSRDPEVAVTVLQGMLDGVRPSNSNNNVVHINDAMEAVLQEYEQQRINSGLRGVTTGFPSLDEATSGMSGGDVFILAGRPNIGKSYKLFKMAHSAWKQGHSGLFVTMEMSVQQCTARLIGMESGINPQLIREGTLSNWAQDNLYSTVRRMEGLPPLHFIAGDFRRTTGDIDAAVEELNPDAVYIDAGYLVSPERDRRRSSKREFIADVIEEIKGSAIKRNKPYAISVQFNRQVTKGSTKPLDLSMIAESDAIGQVASAVIGIQPGEGANSLIERRYELLKNREGVLVSYTGHFRFNPMNFGQIITSGNASGAAFGEDPDATAEEEVVI